MKIKKLLLAAAVLASAPAFAQTLGNVVSVNGVATVTTGTSGSAVVVGAPIVHGARVITTSSGTVTLRLNNGCTVTVPPGHAVTVLSTLTCPQLTAAIQPVQTTVTTTTTATRVPVGIGPFGPGLVNGVVALGLVGIIAGAIAAEDDDDAVLSPN